jgi:DNA-binding YbaB/EbfC family protein
MFKELGQFASLMKQAQGMQGKIAESKQRIAGLKCQGEAGGGMVSVTVGGSMQMIACKIDPALIESGDKEMIEDLIVAATNQAFEKLLEEQAKEMSSIAGGFNLPGLGEALNGLGLGK